MRLGCLRCWQHRDVFTPAAMIYYPWGPPYEVRCDDCNAAMAERQQEQDFADFHGGVAPQSTYDATYGKVR